jgi:phosphoglycolate phosphatase
LVTLRRVPQETVVDELEALGLIRYFDTVMTAFNGCQPKPSPEAFVGCARRLNIKIDRCVVVGDSVVDIRAGKSAGMRTVAVLSGIYSCMELQAEKPDLVLENVSLLPDFVDLLMR